MGTLAFAATAALLHLSNPTPFAQEEPHAAPAPRPRFLELALSDISATLGFRTPTLDGAGFLGASLLVNDDDDVALGAELVRLGEFEALPDVRLGVGIGAHAVFVDRPDANVYAVSLGGLAEYDLPTELPSTVAWQFAFAPDITTFDDGDRLIDTALRLRVDLSDVATAFVGYHLLQVDVGPKIEVDQRFQVGVRLGF